MMLSCKREVSSRVLNALLGWGQKGDKREAAAEAPV